MRIIRLKLKINVSKYLKTTARQYGFDDPGFVEDLFALLRLKGNGIPTTSRIEKLAAYLNKNNKDVSLIGLRLLLNKRRLILESLVKIPYFHGLSKLPDTTAATERLILQFRTMYYKVRAAQCLSCDLISTCDFGKQYSSVIKDIRKVIDPDYEKKVHKDCPELPAIEGLNQFAIGFSALAKTVSNAPEKKAAEMEQHPSYNTPRTTPPPPAASTNEVEGQVDILEQEMAEESLMVDDEDPEDVGDGVVHLDGMEDKPNQHADVEYMGDHNSQSLCSPTEKLIKDLTVKQLMVFELGSKFTKEMQHSVKRKFAPTPELNQSKDSANIEKVSDLTQLVTNQHALPEEVFDKKLANKSLQKNRNLKTQSKKKKLYLLVDNSSSMTKFLGGSSQFQLFTRGALATLFALSIVRRLEEDKGTAYLRFFTGNVSPLYKAEKAEEYEELRNFIGSASFISGSTDIVQVVSVAQKDMKEKGHNMSDVEILLITDCEDSIGEQELKDAIAGAEFNVLDVAGVGSHASTILKAAANRYYKADQNAASLNEIVKLL